MALSSGKKLKKKRVGDSRPAATGEGTEGPGRPSSAAKAPAAASGSGRGRGFARPGDCSGKGWGRGDGGGLGGRGMGWDGGGQRAEGGDWGSRGAGRGGWSRGRGGGAGEAGGADGGHGQRKALQDLLDYLRECTKSLQSGAVGPQEEALLASRAIEELGDRVLLVAADQRGSKLLERLIRPANDEAFAMLFAPLTLAVPELAPNQYASHVLEALFGSWAERQFRRCEEAAKGGASAAGEGTGEQLLGPPLEPLLELCRSLQRDDGWPALVDNACASHVVRGLLLALGGYAPEPKGKAKSTARAGQLPERRFEVPGEVAECRRAVAGVLVDMIKADAEVCLSTHASPVVQLLLRMLRDRKERGLVAEAAAAVVGAAAVGAPPSPERCDAMLRSAPGSRALEAVLETASAEAFAQLYEGYFEPRLAQLTAKRDGEFGAFLVQRLADGMREPAQLLAALGKIDFGNLLAPEATWTMHGVVIKVLEACLRLRAGLVQAAAAVFKALTVGEPSEYSRAWPAVLLLDAKADSPAALLCPAGNRRRNAPADPTAEGARTAPNDSVAAARVLKQLPAAGPQLLSTLLRFPAEAVEPLNSGLPAMFANKDALGALAMERKAARALQAALESTSAVSGKLRLRLAKAFRGLLADLAPDPIGGWVAAAVFKASLGQTALRASLAKEMLSVEESLRVNNFAVWKVCGLNQAKHKTGEWAERQKKAGKAQRMLAEVLDDGGRGAAEAAKAAAEAKRRRQEDAASRRAEASKAAAAARNEQWLSDPVMARLMGGADGADSSADEADEGKGARAMAAVEGRARGKAGDAEERRAAAEIDAVFRQGRRWPGAGSTGDKQGSAATAATASVASKQLVAKDSALAEVLDIIAGKGASSTKKKRGKKRRDAVASVAAKPGDDSDSSDAEGVALVAQAAAKSPPKKKRKGFAFCG